MFFCGFLMLIIDLFLLWFCVWLFWVIFFGLFIVEVDICWFLGVVNFGVVEERGVEINFRFLLVLGCVFGVMFFVWFGSLIFRVVRDGGLFKNWENVGWFDILICFGFFCDMVVSVWLYFFVWDLIFWYEFRIFWVEFVFKRLLNVSLVFCILLKRVINCCVFEGNLCFVRVIFCFNFLVFWK